MAPINQSPVHKQELVLCHVCYLKLHHLWQRSGKVLPLAQKHLQCWTSPPSLREGAFWSSVAEEQLQLLELD